LPNFFLPPLPLLVVSFSYPTARSTHTASLVPLSCQLFPMRCIYASQRLDASFDLRAPLDSPPYRAVLWVTTPCFMSFRSPACLPAFLPLTIFPHSAARPTKFHRSARRALFTAFSPLARQIPPLISSDLSLLLLLHPPQGVQIASASSLRYLKTIFPGIPPSPCRKF